MNTLAEGIRFQLKYEKQDGGQGSVLDRSIAMNGNKDGESIAGGDEETRVHRLRRRGEHRRELPGEDILRLLHRLPRRVQRQPREVHQGREEMTPGLERDSPEPRAALGFLLFAGRLRIGLSAPRGERNAIL